MIKVKQFELKGDQETAQEIAAFLNTYETYKEITITSVGGDTFGLIIVIIKL